MVLIIIFYLYFITDAVKNLDKAGINIYNICMIAKSISNLHVIELVEL